MFEQAAVVPKDVLFNSAEKDVGQIFMGLTLGKTGLSANSQETLWAVFKAISALGNLIVVTFTAARGTEMHTKTCIAKTGC
jgi:hypothetical protein